MAATLGPGSASLRHQAVSAPFSLCSRQQSSRRHIRGLKVRSADDQVRHSSIRHCFWLSGYEYHPKNGIHSGTHSGVCSCCQSTQAFIEVPALLSLSCNAPPLSSYVTANSAGSGQCRGGFLWRNDGGKGEQETKCIRREHTLQKATADAKRWKSSTRATHPSLHYGKDMAEELKEPLKEQALDAPLLPTGIPRLRF